MLLEQFSITLLKQLSVFPIFCLAKPINAKSINDKPINAKPINAKPIV